jgi:hypothetical protein
VLVVPSGAVDSVIALLPYGSGPLMSPAGSLRTWDQRGLRLLFPGVCLETTVEI